MPYEYQTNGLGLLGTLATVAAETTGAPLVISIIVGTLTATYWLLKIIFICIDRWKGRKDKL